jgi:hypothetical protein
MRRNLLKTHPMGTKIFRVIRTMSLQNLRRCAEDAQLQTKRRNEGRRVGVRRASDSRLVLPSELTRGTRQADSGIGMGLRIGKLDMSHWSASHPPGVEQRTGKRGRICDRAGAWKRHQARETSAAGTRTAPTPLNATIPIRARVR